MSWVRFHPITRVIVVVGVILLVAAFAGWERVGSALASVSPRGSFEGRCAELPTSRVEVALLPFSVTENRKLPLEALTRISDGPSPAHRTIGLTHANFGHRSLVDVTGVEDRLGARACVRPSVKVELYVKPITVYVAREYEGDPCRSAVIREHEQRHVNVYTGYAREAANRLESELANAIGRTPFFGASVAEAQRGVDRRLGELLTAFMRESERTLAQRQALVDTPEEYARVTSACAVERAGG